MDLRSYLDNNGLTPNAFAARLNKPASTVHRVLNGKRLPGHRLLAAIEAATNGQVSRSDLRPDLWPQEGAR